MLGFWQEACFKNLTAWLGVTHESRGVLGLFNTFNGSLKLAFSENNSKQVSFVLGLIDQAQWAEEGSSSGNKSGGEYVCACV